MRRSMGAADFSGANPGIFFFLYGRVLGARQEPHRTRRRECRTDMSSATPIRPLRANHNLMIIVSVATIAVLVFVIAII